MTLITGGAYSGKTEFAIKKFNIKSTDIIDGAEFPGTSIRLPGD